MVIFVAVPGFCGREDEQDTSQDTQTTGTVRTHLNIYLPENVSVHCVELMVDLIEVFIHPLLQFTMIILGVSANDCF